MIERLAALRDRLDADGRPLGEVASPLYDGVEVRCPYAGSRLGRPMNPGALRQLGAGWDEVRAALRWLTGPTVRDAWRACAAGTGAPLYAPDPVPVSLAALYKACLGMEQVLLFAALSEPGVADAPLSALGDADGFLAWMERDRWLVGRRQVCAGPPAMIRQMFEALALGGEGHPPADWPDFDIDAHAAAVLDLVEVALGPRCARREQLEAAAPPWLDAVRAAPRTGAEVGWLRG